MYVLPGGDQGTTSPHQGGDRSSAQTELIEALLDRVTHMREQLAEEREARRRADTILARLSRADAEQRRARIRALEAPGDSSEQRDASETVAEEPARRPSHARPTKALRRTQSPARGGVGCSVAGRKRGNMEQGEWMNEQVKQEIEDLRRRFGFEEQEAVAFWHLREARGLIVEMLLADEGAHESNEGEEEDDGEGEDVILSDSAAFAESIRRITESIGQVGPDIANSIAFRVETEARILQHFAALHRELGMRVLRRSYPDGWGQEPFVEEEEG